MAEKYKPGDLVMLKSGGPVMTVSEVLYGDQYKCQWFKGTTAAQAHYPEETLISAQVPEKK